jgi:hypothetical protein
MRGRGAVSLIVLLLSWLALDDITTDSANQFPLEYTILLSAGTWFTALGVSLLAKRRSFAGVSSLVAVGLGVAAFWSLPHHYQPPSPINYLGYVPLAWFVGLTVWLLAARVQAGSGQADQEGLPGGQLRGRAQRSSPLDPLK